MTNAAQIARSLESAIPIIWDRFTKTEDGFYVVYGWIARLDGRADFIIFELWEDSPEDVFCTTSSAKFSKRVMEVLYGSAEGHNDCRKIEELFAE
jgi:hypothetical protein